MLLILQSWLVLTSGLITVLALVIGTQGLARVLRRPAHRQPEVVALVGRPVLRLVPPVGATRAV